MRQTFVLTSEREWKRQKERVSEEDQRVESSWALASLQFRRCFVARRRHLVSFVFCPVSAPHKRRWSTVCKRRNRRDWKDLIKQLLVSALQHLHTCASESVIYFCLLWEFPVKFAIHFMCFYMWQCMWLGSASSLARLINMKLSSSNSKWKWATNGWLSDFFVFFCEFLWA